MGSFRTGSARIQGACQPSFTGAAGKYVSLKDTISSFKAIVAGEYDHLPEQAFYMVGGIEEAVAKAESMKG